MRVEMRFYSIFRLVTGQEELAIELPDESDVRDLLYRLARSCGKSFEEHVFSVDSGTLRHRVILLLNGKNLEFLQGLATSLHDGDQLAFLQPLSGGADPERDWPQPRKEKPHS